MLCSFCQGFIKAGKMTKSFQTIQLTHQDRCYLFVNIRIHTPVQVKFITWILEKDTYLYHQVLKTFSFVGCFVDIPEISGYSYFLWVYTDGICQSCEIDEYFPWLIESAGLAFLNFLLFTYVLCLILQAFLGWCFLLGVYTLTHVHLAGAT